MPNLRLAAIIACLVVCTGGCSSVPPSPAASPSVSAIVFTPIPVVPASLEPGSFRLPTNGAIGGGGCLGVDFAPGVLHGDPADKRTAWVVTSGGRQEVFFPLGFTARFTPRLEVMNRSGRIVAQEGDAVDGGCWTVDDGPVLILSDPSFVDPK